jgi:hypothetical protein
MRRQSANPAVPPLDGQANDSYPEILLHADRLDLRVIESDNPVLVLSDGIHEVRITAGEHGFNVHELLGVRRLSDTVSYYLRLCNRLAKIRRMTLDEHHEKIATRSAGPRPPIMRDEPAT